MIIKTLISKIETFIMKLSFLLSKIKTIIEIKNVFLVRSKTF